MFHSCKSCLFLFRMVAILMFEVMKCVFLYNALLFRQCSASEHSACQVSTTLEGNGFLLNVFNATHWWSNRFDMFWFDLEHLAAHRGDSTQSGHLQTSGSSEILDGAEAGMKTRIGKGGLTWPMAKLLTFWDYIFSRENKVQTFFSRVHWLSDWKEQSALRRFFLTTQNWRC